MKPGDLEGDTIFDKNSGNRLLIHVGRETGILSISLIKGHNAGTITTKVAEDIERIFGEIHSTTYNNGADFKKLAGSDIMKIEFLMNSRSRKHFQWLTLLEYHEQCCT